MAECCRTIQCIDFRLECLQILQTIDLVVDIGERRLGDLRRQNLEKLIELSSPLLRSAGIQRFHRMPVCLPNDLRD